MSVDNRSTYSNRGKRINQEMRRRKKKIRRIKNIGKRILLLACVILFIYLGYTIINGAMGLLASKPEQLTRNESVEELTKPKKYAKSQVNDRLEQLAQTSKEYREIYNNIDQYPASFLTSLCSNSEMLPFVLGYKKNTSITNRGFTETELNDKFPLLLQWDKRWGYEEYGDSCIGIAGCAPTCMSMVVLSLTKNENATPKEVASFAQSGGYYSAGVGTSWSFLTEGAAHFAVNGNELSLTKRAVFSALKEGHPIICSMKPGDFTSQGHFITLVGVKDGKIIVNDPNSRKRSNVLWSYERIDGQIKNLWSYEK